MKRVLVVPWSIAAAYFAINNSFRPCVVHVSPCVRRRCLDGKLVGNDRAENAADDRPDHGYQGVFPIGPSLAWYRQQEVRDSGHEVTSGVDRVARRSTQRKADGEDEQADDQRGEPTDQAISLGGDGDDPEDEHECADDLADEVERWVADRRARAEDGELQTGILGLLPVMAVMDPHQDRPDERSHQFTAD